MRFATFHCTWSVSCLLICVVVSPFFTKRYSSFIIIDSVFVGCNPLTIVRIQFAKKGVQFLLKLVYSLDRSKKRKTHTIWRHLWNIILAAAYS